MIIKIIENLSNKGYSEKRFHFEAREIKISKYRIFDNVFYGYKDDDYEHINFAIKKTIADKLNITLEDAYKLFNRLLRKGLDEITKRLSMERINKSLEDARQPSGRKYFKDDSRIHIFYYMVISNKTNLKFPVEVEVLYNGQVNAIYTTALDKEEHLIHKHNEEEIYLKESKNSYFTVNEFYGSNQGFEVEFNNGVKREFFSEIEID